MKKIFCISFFLPFFLAVHCFGKTQYAFASSSVVSVIKKENNFFKKVNATAPSDIKIQYRYKKKKVRGVKRGLFVLSGERPFICTIKIENAKLLPETFYFGRIILSNGK